jgi:CHASE3 domain sensor protein
MLNSGPGGDGVTMTPSASPLAGRLAVRERDRTSAQIRRFALLWMAASIGVLLSVAMASLVASHYRDDAARRARANADAELAVAHLQAQIEGQAANVLGYRSTGEAIYRQQFSAGGRDMRAALASLRQAAITAGRHHTDMQLLAAATHDTTAGRGVCLRPETRHPTARWPRSPSS